jgi:nitrite reductase/ring-hydroxylating ferredoxin subunit
VTNSHSVAAAADHTAPRRPPADGDWYRVARGDHIGRALTGWCVDGLPVAIYRRIDGSPVAVVDRCPHLWAPLSSTGELVGDDIECRLHHIRFDSGGQAVPNHCYRTVPVPYRLEVLDVAEDHGWVSVRRRDPSPRVEDGRVAP